MRQGWGAILLNPENKYKQQNKNKKEAGIKITTKIFTIG